MAGKELQLSAWFGVLDRSADSVCIQAWLAIWVFRGACSEVIGEGALAKVCSEVDCLTGWDCRLCSVTGQVTGWASCLGEAAGYSQQSGRGLC